MNRREILTALAIAPIGSAAIAKTVVNANGNYVAPVTRGMCRWMGQDLPLADAVRRFELMFPVLRQQNAGNVGQESFGG